MFAIDMKGRSRCLRKSVVALLATSAYSVSAQPAAAASEPPRLIHSVAASRTHIAFSHAGDLWMVERSGGVARQLTRGPAEDSDPAFSPDGTQLAFSRLEAGDRDVYRASPEGGEPVRLTFHPSDDVVRGWTPDGQNIVFSSMRGARWERHLHTVPKAGGRNDRLPVPTVASGVVSPDGGQLIYSPLPQLVGLYANSWRKYRGGLATKLEQADLRTGQFAELSSGDASDRSPTYAGDVLVIASDRDRGVFNLFTLDLQSREATQLTRFDDFSVGALAGTPDGKVVFVRDGRLYEIDVRSRALRGIPVDLAPDRSELKARELPAASWLSGAVSGPGGKIAAAARGDILLFDPVNRGWTNITRSSGANDHDPRLSRDGRRLAYISDAAGQEDLYVRHIGASGAAGRISLPRDHSGYTELTWSPNGSKIALSDRRGTLWIADPQSRKVSKITSRDQIGQQYFHPTWSVDGRWLAYVKLTRNGNNALFFFDSSTGKVRPITDGTVDASRPAFDPAGRTLFFVTSSNAALPESFGMYEAGFRENILRELRAYPLDGATSSPFEAPAGGGAKASPALPLSGESVAQRTWTASTGQRDYTALIPTRGGRIFVTVREWPPTPGGSEPTSALYRFDPAATERFQRVAGDIDHLLPTADGSGVTYRAEEGWWTLAEDAEAPVPISFEGATVPVDPSAEWRQIYQHAWRIARDRFYDPGYHGQDIAALEKHYANYLPGITRRTDLNNLLYTALGHLSVSHLSISGGDVADAPSTKSKAGVLGVDLTEDQGRYRFTRIHDPSALTAPPGAARNPLEGRVRVGDYLLALDDGAVRADANVDSHLLGKAGRPVRLTVGPRSDGRGARTIVVTPLASDMSLRDRTWVEANRRTVNERSKGTVGYVYIPDFVEDGVIAFIRELTAASDKRALLIDVRWNGGGWPADIFLDLLKRSTLNYYKFKDADDLAFPAFSIDGPKAVLINQRNSSAAETFAWWSRKTGVAKLVGARTAGAGVGHYYEDSLKDEATITMPMRAFFTPDGSWSIENHGIVPDVAVRQDPALLLQGRDPQLEAATALLVQEQAGRPVSRPVQPQPADRGRPGKP